MDKTLNFYKDVICKDPRFNTLLPVRDPTLLEPNFKAKITALIADAARQGITLQILETYRSAQRQLVLFNKGATKLKQVGVHHYGLACDIGIVHNGTVDWNADYKTLGKLAEAHRMVWGGDWGTPDAPHNFRDYDHVQGVTVAKQAELFAGTWYPDSNYDPLKELGR